MLDTILTDFINCFDFSLPKKPKLTFTISLQEASPTIFSCLPNLNDQQSLLNLVVKIKCSHKKIKNLKLRLNIYSNDIHKNIFVEERYQELSPEHEIIFRLNSTINTDDIIVTDNKITLILNYEYSFFFFKKTREEKSSWICSVKD